MQFRSLSFAFVCLLVLGRMAAQPASNLLPDPSIEETRSKNQFGVPYTRWSGWIFEGSPEFRVGKVARTGRSSAEMVGAQGGKIRLYTPPVTLEPGRYRFSCFVRGLDIGMSEDLNFADEQYYPLKKTGTFGWTRLEIVKDVPKKQEVTARIGLWGAGRLWVDDAEIVRVPDSTPLSGAPAFSTEEKPVAPPGPLEAAKAVRCPDCGNRNMPAWVRCYACGETLASGPAPASGPDVRPLADFADGTVKPFSPQENLHVATEHAPAGKKALKIDKDFTLWEGPQDWTGYDFWKADVYNASSEPASFYFEVKDKATTDYWTRVNYTTVLPPGASTVIIPTDLYVGEKSRPGRPMDKANITRLAVNIGAVKAPVFLSNLRLERDLSDRVKVLGLMAFSFGPGTSPPMRGFLPVTPSTQYSPGRGYGLKNAQIWRAYDALQPDPLYQVGICIERGGFAVDLPDGKYHVFMNLDNPSGFWGEYQVYRERTVTANGVRAFRDTIDLPAFRAKYFRFADVEDYPWENTFDKYQRAYFKEKEFDVEVKGGQLLLEFTGENWANSLSALVVYPAGTPAKVEAGRKFLENLQERRRFYFGNSFKRVLANRWRDAKGAIPSFQASPVELAEGYVVWARDWMEDVPSHGVPRREEVTSSLTTFASAGQREPIVFCVTSLKELGACTVTVSDLVSTEGARVPASAIQAGVVSHRLTRVTADGAVYTIAPRLILPRDRIALKKDITTTFWLTLQTPAAVKAGSYKGIITLAFADGRKEKIDLNARLFSTPLDALDVPAGPFGSRIDLPWYGEETAAYNQEIYRKCLAKMREYGLTAFSGMPTLRIDGWEHNRPIIDFTQADREMAEARAAGFQMVVNYGASIGGFDNYFVDENAMKSAGFKDYEAFLRRILTAVDEHAKAANWLPVAYNLCDEPLGETVPRATANAKAWRAAAPPSFLTTGATSTENPKPDDPHLLLAQALKIPALNLHDEPSIKAIHGVGSDWSFYNGGSRWTFGTYMFKCAKEYGMKYRLSWHWNAGAGDPYYALDCREDDYAWCMANAKGELIPSIHFERDILGGVNDYRYLQTLARLVRAKPGHPAAPAAKKLLEDKLASFKLGEREHDTKWPLEEYRTFRLKLAEAIERLGE